jgi:hypothetical protein
MYRKTRRGFSLLMELIVEEIEKAPLDASVAYRCDLCDYNPYQAWCKGNIARFHGALMKHKQSRRHIEAEAFARGEQPIHVSKEGVVSATEPERPPHFYITKLETMIDKLEQRIDALNNAYDPSETSEEYNLNNLGSLVDDFRPDGSYWKTEKSGESVNPPNPPSFQFKEIEMDALRRFGDGSCITNTNTMNAISRCLSWCEVMVKDEGRRAKNIAYLTKTREMIKAICGLVAEGWRAEEEDYDVIGERLDSIMEHDFYV